MTKYLTLDLEDEYHRQLELDRISISFEKIIEGLDKLIAKSKESEVKDV